MLTTIGQQSQSMQADAAAAGLMVSNCASLVSAGWQCMHIWLSSDVPVLAIGQQSQSMQADAAAASLMVSNCASLVSAGWQCMYIWLSSDVPVLPRLSVSLQTDNSLPPPRSARLPEVTT